MLCKSLSSAVFFFPFRLVVLCLDRVLSYCVVAQATIHDPPASGPPVLRLHSMDYHACLVSLFFNSLTNYVCCEYTLRLI